MSSAITIATVALQGASVIVSAELSIRCLSSKRNKLLHIRVFKFLMGLTMSVKTFLFLAFHASIGNPACDIIGRTSDLFYHLSMTAGTAVLVSRVNPIIPIQWKRPALVTHISMVVIRLVFGVVGTAVVTIGTFENGACDYKDTEYWGPVYTIYDTFIDLYVTVVISVVLISHIRSLDLGSIRVNISLYTSVVYNNIIRTVLLTIVNTISAVFIITRNKNEYIMLVWPIINIIFIVLLGYDSDVTKAIRQLQQRRWNKDISSSHISLDHSASASRAPDKRQLRPTELRRMSDSNLYTEKALSDEGYKAPNLFNKSVGNTSCDTDNTQIEV